MSHKTLKKASAKKSFPSMYIIDKTSFDICFLFHVIIGKHYFLRKFSTTQRFGAIAILLRSLTQVFWNRSAFYVRYLQSNISIRPFNAANTKGPKWTFYFSKFIKKIYKFVDSVSSTLCHFVNIHNFLYKWNF